jgi:hypothetical protein
MGHTPSSDAFVLAIIAFIDLSPGKQSAKPAFALRAKVNEGQELTFTRLEAAFAGEGARATQSVLGPP